MCLYHITGTHDIQNVTVSSPLPGQIRVTGDLVDGSNATGMLLILYSPTNVSHVHYIAKQTEQGDSVRQTDIILVTLIIM